MVALLHLEDLAIDLIGDADAAAPGDAAGVFLHQHGAVDLAAHAIVAERALRAAGREQAIERLLEEHGFEILRRLARLGLGLSARLKRFRELPGGAGRELAGRAERQPCEGSCHHITSISACRAPEALMACRIEIMSRGPMPSAFSPST